MRFSMNKLANRTKPGPSFQLYMWSRINIDKYMHIIKRAKVIVENLDQTSFRFSPISFCAARISLVAGLMKGLNSTLVRPNLFVPPQNFGHTLLLLVLLKFSRIRHVINKLLELFGGS